MPRPPEVPLHTALCICSFVLDFCPLCWCVNIWDWAYAALLLLTDALPLLPLKHTGRSQKDTCIILSSSSLKPCSVFAHMSYLHFRVSLRPSHPSNHVSVFSSTPPSLHVPLRLQGAVPLIWPSVHLIHLSRLQSEDQEDSHGSVQVTNSSLSLSSFWLFPTFPACSFFPLVLVWHYWCMIFSSTTDKSQGWHFTSSKQEIWAQGKITCILRSAAGP